MVPGHMRAGARILRRGSEDTTKGRGPWKQISLDFYSVQGCLAHIMPEVFSQLYDGKWSDRGLPQISLGGGYACGQGDTHTDILSVSNAHRLSWAHTSELAPGVETVTNSAILCFLQRMQSPTEQRNTVLTAPSFLPFFQAF